MPVGVDYIVIRRCPGGGQVNCSLVKPGEHGHDGLNTLLSPPSMPWAGRLVDVAGRAMSVRPWKGSAFSKVAGTRLDFVPCSDHQRPRQRNGDDEVFPSAFGLWGTHALALLCRGLWAAHALLPPPVQPPRYGRRGNWNVTGCKGGERARLQHQASGDCCGRMKPTR